LTKWRGGKLYVVFVKIVKGGKNMKKIIFIVAAVAVVASAFASTPLGSTWGVQPLRTDGFHGSLGGGANELVGYQAGPVFSANGTLQGSYGFQNGWVVYGSVLGSRSFDALPNTPNNGNTSRTGNNINSLFSTLGMQKQLNPDLLVGAQITYGNYALAPASSMVTVDNESTTSSTAPCTFQDAHVGALTDTPSGIATANALINWVNSTNWGTHIANISNYDQWTSGIGADVYSALTAHGFGFTSIATGLVTTGGRTSPQLDFKTVGFGFNPYAQYTFGQSTVYGSYTLQELQNSGMQTIIGYTGSGVGHNFTGGYSYAMTHDLTVGLSGTYQVVNQPYTYAALVQYANSNNYQAAIGSEDYISIMPGVNYNISAIQGLSLGLNTGLNWFNFRKCNAPANGYANFMSAFVIIPSVNYQIPLAENFVWSSNAQYNGVKMINASNVETGASMNGQTLNSSFQVTTGLTYSF